MKTEPSIAARSLRAVGLVITLVSIVTFSTVIYSALVDYEAFVGSLQAGTKGPGVSGSAALVGSNLVLELNVTARNSGLYPVSLTMECSSIQPAGATCKGAQTVVPPGQDGTLDFQMSIPNGTLYTSGARQLHINGTVTVGLQPFASIGFDYDFGTLFVPGGG